MNIKEYRHNYYLKNKERFRESLKKYRHNYYLKNKEKEMSRAISYNRNNSERVSLVSKKYKINNSEKVKEWLKVWRYKNKHKIKAQNKLQYAIKKGIITRKPCVVCGKEKSEAHHEDYSKPFDVIWLCNKHHNQLRRKY